MSWTRRFLYGAAVAIASAGWAAHAAGYPDKPVRLIVSFSPGGSVDATARLLSDALTRRWGQPVVVENRPGADGNIAAEFVTRAPPDGYTLLITSNSISISPALRKLPFDPLRDLTPVIRVLSIPNLLVVNPAVPAQNLAELVRQAKREPGKLTYASSGTATTPFMGMALLISLTGMQMVHVPFKGTAPALTATLGKQTDLMFGDVNSTLPFVQAGKLRALAISSSTRLNLSPDIPTVAESGYADFDTSTWVGIFSPAGTPSPVLDRIAADIGSLLGDPGFRKRLGDMGAQVNGESMQTFAHLIRDDIARWRKVAAEQQISATD
ncbi:tripartite tricarboxylate transporter substrate binding protein [Bordetella sp. BOR01]|uniref:tripartite tricarboxylate transporter substrate binding protein n=1 Tax=Bordetella sp. BOR01 TaxID=2854779 RepID=UPI001C46ECFA|nr:tripartite tricarboxylate transporter substrate binding protein [Bordetella sp. BOR01]MBV7484861.1 tripartite tricarboxylate transporter substrate binding protein [Bordetella sp. BOR01]